MEKFQALEKHFKLISSGVLRCHKRLFIIQREAGVEGKWFLSKKIIVANPKVTMQFMGRALICQEIFGTNQFLFGTKPKSQSPSRANGAKGGAHLRFSSPRPHVCKCSES